MEKFSHNVPRCYYRVSVKALIHNEEGKFVLVKEDNNIWELPGGGESIIEKIYENALKEKLKKKCDSMLFL